MNENTLVLSAKNGDSQAFADLYDLYVEQIYRFIYYKVSHRETAEDLTSTVFMKVLQGLKKFHPEKASFKTWVYSIARNTVVDYYRKKKHVELNDEMSAVLESDLNSTDKAHESLTKEQVQELMKSLNDNERDILTLRFWEGLSFKEIAEIIGKSENASKVACSRAITRLRELYPGLSALLLHFFTL